jgi:hypothetical protein
LPEIVGSATLAMVVSSTCMKVASDRPMVLSSRLGGRERRVIAHRESFGAEFFAAGLALRLLRRS